MLGLKLIIISKIGPWLRSIMYTNQYRNPRGMTLKMTGHIAEW